MARSGWIWLRNGSTYFLASGLGCRGAGAHSYQDAFRWSSILTSPGSYGGCEIPFAARLPAKVVLDLLLDDLVTMGTHTAVSTASNGSGRKSFRRAK